MMSTADNVVPFLAAPKTLLTRGATRFSPSPGLSPEAIQGLESSFPGTLTQEMRALLRSTCGLTSDGLGSIDFTGQWYPDDEPIDVLRPCITLNVDDEGRRWVAETSRAVGLPGPVWCVLPEPAVAMYLADDLSEFLSSAGDVSRPGRLSRWFRELYCEARSIWVRRHALAREAYLSCKRDPGVRGWLAELPIDAHVFDLRGTSPPRGWPYGLAGPDGHLYRCGRLPIFAVCGSHSPSRWTQHMVQIAKSRELLTPAIARAVAA